MIITHYYSVSKDESAENSKVRHSITESDKATQQNVALELSTRQGRALRRFDNFDTYLQRRITTEEWLYRDFRQAGGTPLSKYPIYFVLGEDKMLQQDFGENVKILQIDICNIPKSQISFTIGDSMGVFFSSAPKTVYTLDMLLAILQTEESLYKYFSFLDTYHRYIEAQVWDKKCIENGIIKSLNNTSDDNQVPSFATDNSRLSTQ